jgi:hypothetical protein
MLLILLIEATEVSDVIRPFRIVLILATILESMPDTCTVVRSRFLDAIASNGGTVMLLFILTQISFVMAAVKMPKGEDVMYLCCGALLGVLKGETTKKTGELGSVRTRKAVGRDPHDLLLLMDIPRMRLFAVVALAFSVCLSSCVGVQEKDFKISLTGSEGTAFSGSYMVVQSGSSSSQTVEGTVPRTFRAKGSMVSVAFQKKTPGTLTVTITGEGITTKSQSTTAEFGMVTIATQ